MAPGAKSKRRLLLYLTGAVLLLLGLAQLLLPRIAASRIRSRISRYGKVESVNVSAWPAIKLLWGSADTVDVRAGALSLGPSQASSLVEEAKGVANLHLSASSIAVGGLRVADVTLTKHGAQLSANGLVSGADVTAALPEGVSVQLVRSEGGEVEVRVSGGLFGLGTSIDAVAKGSEGKLVARPIGLFLGSLELTLFSDPRVYVLGVGASEHSADPLIYRVEMRALLK